MMGVDLSGYKDGDWLGPGQYEVTVQSYSRKTIGDKNAYEFILRANEGQTKITIYRTTEAMWRFAKFARRCGLTDVEMKSVTPDMLVGRSLIVTVEPDRDPKYNSVHENFHSADPRAGANGGTPTEAKPQREPRDEPKLQPVDEFDEPPF